MTKPYLWPEDAIELVRANASSKTASQIVQILPLDKNGKAPTRCGIIGKCHRLGIRLGDPSKNAAVNRINAQKPRKRGEVGAVTGAAALKGAPRAKPGFKPPKKPGFKPPKKPGFKPPKEPPLAPGMPETEHLGAYAVLGLSSRTCHWPVGDPQDDDFRFCCAPMELGERYCAHHKHISIDHARTKRSEKKANRNRRLAA